MAEYAATYEGFFERAKRREAEALRLVFEFSGPMESFGSVAWGCYACELNSSLSYSICDAMLVADGIEAVMAARACGWEPPQWAVDLLSDYARAIRAVHPVSTEEERMAALRGPAND